MNNQDRKYPNIETQYAALTAICNLLVLLLITIAGGGLFFLFDRINEFYAALAVMTNR